MTNKLILKVEDITDDDDIVIKKIIRLQQSIENKIGALKITRNLFNLLSKIIIFANLDSYENFKFFKNKTLN